MNAGLMPGSSTKKLTTQTPTSAVIMNGSGLAISGRCDDRARQPNESAIPRTAASNIWTVTPKATGAEGNSALTPAAVVTARANVAGLAPVAPAYSVTHAISARPPATPATTPWRVVSSSVLTCISASSSNVVFRDFPPNGPIMALSSSIAAGQGPTDICQ